MNIALIVFAGSGSRMSSSIPKQFIRINGHELVAYTINVFEKHPLIDEIVLVTSKDYIAFTKNLVYTHNFRKVSMVIEGGDTRQASVRNGLNKTNYDKDSIILIHDGDRPMIDDNTITNCVREMEHSKGCTVLIKSKDALKEVSNLGRKYDIKGVSYDIQTPQCFRYGSIKDLHNRYKDEQVNDDVSLMLLDHQEVSYVNGRPVNFKITQDKDLEYLKTIIGEY